jgi:hypothetical protein
LEAAGFFETWYDGGCDIEAEAAGEDDCRYCPASESDELKRRMNGFARYWKSFKISWFQRVPEITIIQKYSKCSIYFNFPYSHGR